MEIEEAKKLKAELETNIKELLCQFEAKTGLYTQIRDVKINTASDRFAKEKEEEINVIDMTGDMTDTEFEQIVYEVSERMKDCMYLTGKQRIRETLERHRAVLTSMASMEILIKFEYDGDYFSQILGGKRRKK